MQTDEEWLLKRKPEATDDEIHNFVERVGIKLDGNTNWTAVDVARNDILEEK